MNDQPAPTRVPTLNSVSPEVAPARAASVGHSVEARQSRRLATIGAILLLCLLSVVFFWRVVLLHRVLVPFDILYAPQGDPLWQYLAPPAFTDPANPLDTDNVMQFYPWAALAAQALHHGILPLWNPYAFSGTPFLAALQPAVLSPINLLLEWGLPPVDVPGSRAIVHLAVAFVGTFLFARRLGQSSAGGLLAALAFGLSLPYVVWLEHPMSAATAWLPWLLLCIEGMIASRGSLRWLIATAAVVALEMLAGHGESAAHVVLLGTAFALFRAALAWQQWRSPAVVARLLVALVAALCLGIGIAAIQLLPALAQLPISEAAADRSMAADAVPYTLDILLGDPKQWSTLLVAVVPNFFGHPTWHEFLLPDANYNEIALYVGTVPLLLAAVALLGRRDAYTAFFAAAALVALGVAIQLPALGLLNNLPVLRVTANGRLRLEYAFTVAILAGYGLDRLSGAAKERVTWRLIRVWSLVVVVLAAISAGHAHGLPLGVAIVAAAPALWIALAVGLLWLHRRGVLPIVALQRAALGLVAADLFVSGSGYHTAVSPALAKTTPPAVRIVQHDRSLYRVVGLGNALLPSLSSLYGLQDVRGYDPTYSAAYERYFAASFTTLAVPGTERYLASFGYIPRLAPVDPGAAATRALALMNVKYVLAACNVPLNTRVYRLEYRGAGCVYRNSAVMPRALLVHAVRWAAPARAAVLLNQGIVNPRFVALLDPTTADAAAWSVAPVARSQHADTVRVTTYSLNRVDLVTRSATRALLVLGDAYATGWQARVDEHPTPIARANAVFRAVAVPPGSHRVSFTYEPESFKVGALISAVSLGLWFLLLLVSGGRQALLVHARRP
jgi:hypothetical protein